jgi:branched-chain amino acid transport system substrate-binding protein
VLETLRTCSIGLAIVVGLLATSARGEILIGFAGSLTGPYMWGTEQHLIGAQRAVSDLNDAGGVLGEAIEMTTADDHCEGEQGVAAAKKLIADGVVFVVGHICSGASIPASAVYADAGILMISPGSTSPKLTDQRFSSVFRVAGRDDLQGVMAGDYLADHWGDQDIAILHDGEVYGQRLAEETRRRLHQHGVREVLFAEIEAGRPDYRDEIEEMRDLGVDVLYYAGYSAEAGLIIRQARELGYDLHMIGGDGVGTADFGLIAGPAGDGTLMIRPADSRGDAVFSDATSSDAISSYAAVQVWAQAVEMAQIFDNAAVADALRRNEFDTVLGRIGFDDKGDVTGIETFDWFVWEGGEYVPLEESRLID